jgi:hypothetical protein
MLLEEDQLYTFFAVVDEGKRADGERVEGDREILAVLVGTLHHRFVLAVHQIYHNGLVPLEIGLPTFLGDDIVRSTIIILSLCVRFVDNPVQILMQTIKQISNQLPRVMLVVP